jgi:cyclophilin family peptidyl-prolyl cis-trans isomerase
MNRPRLIAALIGVLVTTAAQAKNPVVVVETSYGPIKVELFEDKAPNTVKNFLTYVDDKHYDGTIFHRVISNFMIQGGGFTPGMTEKKTRDKIKNESTNGLKNQRGTIAMARTSDPDSATAQFYINVVDNPNLDRSDSNPGYCVFGRVIEGIEVADKIRQVTTTTVKQFSDLPVEDIVIKSVRREKQ